MRDVTRWRADAPCPTPSASERAPGREHELVPDAIASDGDIPGAMSASTEPRAATEAPYTAEGRIGTELANVVWRFRARRLGDGER